MESIEWLNRWSLALLSIGGAGVRFAWARRRGSPLLVQRLWAWSIAIAAARWDRDLLIQAAGIDPSTPGAMTAALAELARLRSLSPGVDAPTPLSKEAQENLPTLQRHSQRRSKGVRRTGSKPFSLNSGGTARD